MSTLPSAVLDLPNEPCVDNDIDITDPPLSIDASYAPEPSSDDDLHFDDLRFDDPHFDDDADPDQPSRPGPWRVDHSTGDHHLSGRVPSEPYLLVFLSCARG